MMYKPPEREEHMNVVEYLDEIDHRLKYLEEHICGHARCDLPGKWFRGYWELHNPPNTPYRGF